MFFFKKKFGGRGEKRVYFWTSFKKNVGWGLGVGGGKGRSGGGGDFF